MEKQEALKLIEEQKLEKIHIAGDFCSRKQDKIFFGKYVERMINGNPDDTYFDFEKVLSYNADRYGERRKYKMI